MPPRETVAIAGVAIAIVGRGGLGSLPYTVANEKKNEGINNIANGPVNNMSFLCYKVTDDTFSSIVEDQIICQSVLEI